MKSLFETTKPQLLALYVFLGVFASGVLGFAIRLLIMLFADAKVVCFTPANDRKMTG